MSIDQFAIDGVSVAVLVFGIVEACKSFGLEDTRAIRLLVLVLSALFVTLAQIVPVLDANTQTVITLVITSVAGALSAMGYYDYAKARIWPTQR